MWRAQKDISSSSSDVTIITAGTKTLWSAWTASTPQLYWPESDHRQRQAKPQCRLKATSVIIQLWPPAKVHQDWIMLFLPLKLCKSLGSKHQSRKITYLCKCGMFYSKHHPIHSEARSFIASPLGLLSTGTSCPRDAVESPSLEVSKKQLVIAHNAIVQLTRWDLVKRCIWWSPRSFPILMIPWSEPQCKAE